MSNDTFPIKVKISIYSKKDGGKNIIRKDTTNSVGFPIVFNEFRGVIQLTLAGENKEYIFRQHSKSFGDAPTMDVKINGKQSVEVRLPL